MAVRSALGRDAVFSMWGGGDKQNQNDQDSRHEGNDQSLVDEEKGEGQSCCREKEADDPWGDESDSSEEKKQSHPSDRHTELAVQRKAVQCGLTEERCEGRNLRIIVMSSKNHNGVFPEAVEGGTDGAVLFLLDAEEKIIERHFPECCSGEQNHLSCFREMQRGMIAEQKDMLIDEKWWMSSGFRREGSPPERSDRHPVGGAGEKGKVFLIGLIGGQERISCSWKSISCQWRPCIGFR